MNQEKVGLDDASILFSKTNIMQGEVSSINEHGLPVVVTEDGRKKIAKTLVEIDRSKIGRKVALMYLSGDLNQPVIMGLFQSPFYSALDQGLSTRDNSIDVVEEKLTIKNEKIENIKAKNIVVEGEDELVFKCGESSMTLKADGNISIRGKNILSRASRLNKIKGGCIQMN